MGHIPTHGCIVSSVELPQVQVRPPPLGSTDEVTAARFEPMSAGHTYGMIPGKFAALNERLKQTSGGEGAHAS